MVPPTYFFYLSNARFYSSMGQLYSLGLIMDKQWEQICNQIYCEH
jgi:hypothetical protein